MSTLTTWRHRPTLRPEEVAKLTGLSLGVVVELIEDGTLDSIAVRGHVLVTVASVHRLFDPKNRLSPGEEQEIAELTGRIADLE